MSKRLSFLVVLIVILMVGCNNNAVLIDNADFPSYLEVTSDVEVEPVAYDEPIEVWDMFSFEDCEASEVLKFENITLVGFSVIKRRNENHVYTAYDDLSKTYFSIPSMEQIIESVDVENGQFVFKGNGQNGITPFKDFKENYYFSLITNELTTQKAPMKAHECVEVGNGVNAVLLKEVTANNGMITFDFGPHENTILAGGQFAPDINIECINDHEVIIDIDNAYIEEDNLLSDNNKAVVELLNYFNLSVGDLKRVSIALTLEEKFTLGEFLFVTGEDGFSDLAIRYVE